MRNARTVVITNAKPTWQTATASGATARTFRRAYTFPAAYETEDATRASSPTLPPEAIAASPWPVSSTTPTNPTPSPTNRLTVIGSSCRNRAAVMIVKSGTVALRIDASDDSTVCSPNVMSQNGSTMLSTAMTTRWPIVRLLRGMTGRMARNTSSSSANPNTSRSITSVSGRRPSSTPIRMNR
jgi:hypothetical protein